MSPLNRYLTRPLVFALLGIATVVAFGEPVSPPQSAAAAPVVAAEGTLRVVEVELATPAPAARRADHASRMRWMITLPSARNSCCRRPV